MADEITPDEGAVAVEEPVVEEPTAGAAPWHADLEARFSDPDVRSQVDAYVREVVQPHTTQLEQRLAGIPDGAVDFYNDLNESPSETYLGLTRELFGEDAEAAVIAALQGGPAAEEPDEEIEYDETPEAPARDPEVEELLQERRAAQQKAAYDAELARVVEAHPDIYGVESNIHPFVAAAGGDFDSAIAGYKEFLKGLPGGTLPQAGDVPDVPPAVIGSGSLAPSTPPIQKNYGSLDDALDDFFTETRPSTAPPTV